MAWWGNCVPMAGSVWLCVAVETSGWGKQSELAVEMQVE
jgi:hypothetical protein